VLEIGDLLPFLRREVRIGSQAAVMASAARVRSGADGRHGDGSSLWSGQSRESFPGRMFSARPWGAEAAFV